MTLYHVYPYDLCEDKGLYSELPEKERCRAWTRTVWRNPISYMLEGHCFSLTVYATSKHTDT